MSSKIKVLVVDDEKLARDGLKINLSKFDQIEVVGEAENGFEAVKLNQELNPDLLFLDIQMPKLDGFDVVSLLGQDPPWVVFVTAFDEYALKAFEVNAVDYLVKPVNPERLQKTIANIEARFDNLSLKREQKGSLDRTVQQYQEESKPLERIVIKDGARIHIIPLEEIVGFSAEDDYINVITRTRSFLKHDTMTRINNLLPNDKFCRIHRSHIINLDFLQKVEPYSKDSKIAVMQEGLEFPISRSGYKKLMDMLQQ
jgi:two-component system LytT family response regulator